jgi:hypothetical protein
MPTGDIVVISGIIIAFALFAAVLMWGDFYTKRREQH